MPTYAYARVSSTDQNEARQFKAFEHEGIAPKHVFLDKQSGKDFQRPQWQKLMRKIKAGDCIVVCSLDRIGRDYEEIQEQWRTITKKKQVDIVVLDMPLLDTRRERNLLGSFISDLVLQVLAFVAQQERESICKRQAEGIAAAKQRGVHFGRKFKPLPATFLKNYELWRDGHISGIEAAKRCQMPQSTFYKKAARL